MIANGAITTPDGAEVEYVQFGRGPVPVVTIPGAGDGLNTVKKAALQLAFLYRKRRKHCRMTIFSRRIPYPAGFGVEALARPSKYADRFVHLLQDLYDVDHRDQLPHITCPAWISHGEEDQIIPPTLAQEAAELLPNSTLTLYPKYGHGNEIENPRLSPRLSRFYRPMPLHLEFLTSIIRYSIVVL